MCNKGAVLITEPEVIALDDKQKLVKVGKRTIYVSWNKYVSCYEGELFVEKQDKYGRFVNEFVTGVTGLTETQVIQEAMKIDLNS